VKIVKSLNNLISMLVCFRNVHLTKRKIILFMKIIRVCTNIKQFKKKKWFVVCILLYYIIY